MSVIRVGPWRINTERVAAVHEHPETALVTLFLEGNTLRLRGEEAAGFLRVYDELHPPALTTIDPQTGIYRAADLPAGARA